MSHATFLPPPPTQALSSTQNGPNPAGHPLSAPMGDLSWLSHELRTPMTSLKGAIELLASGTCGTLPPALVPLVDIAHRNSHRLADMLEDLLQVGQLHAGRPDAGHKPLVLRETELAVLLREVLAAHRHQGNIARQPITLTELVTNSTILADPPALKRALNRLLDNANRAALPNTHVAVSLARHGPSLRLSFRYQGPAMAANTHAAHHCNLGITIAGDIVSAHGGALIRTHDPAHTSIWHADFPPLDQSGVVRR